MSGQARKAAAAGSTEASPAAARLLRHSAGASALLRLMANPLRLRVLCLLVDGERSVGQINAVVGLSSSALSQHLAKLRMEGLVDTRKQAQTVYYSLRPGPALSLIQTLHRQYCPLGHAPVEGADTAGGEERAAEAAD
jgi:DNA-binding transcriptional ArsR family regulator